MRIAILTISDAGSRGERADTSGDAIEQWARSRNYEVVERAVVPDDTTLIVQAITRWTDTDAAELVLTTGGTGLGLSIVARTMAAHGGGVSVEDTPGGGASFALHFPPMQRRSDAGRPIPAVSGAAVSHM